MKRFLSTLLVAILVVTSLATVAFAATEVKTGDEKTFTVTVSGDEFTNFGIQLSADDGLEITGISGNVVGNVSNGMVAYAGMTNVDNHSFDVTVKVNATKSGTYNVYASVLQAGKQVTELDGDGNSVFKLVDASVSANGASFVIPEPECKHEHEKWGFNEDEHWHICKNCGENYGTAKHSMVPMKENGMQWTECECGYATEKTPVPTEPVVPETTEPVVPETTEPQPTEPQPTEPRPTEPSDDGKDEVADTGDITPYGLFNTMIAVVVLAMVSAVVLAFKRKTAK